MPYWIVHVYSLSKGEGREVLKGSKSTPRTTLLHNIFLVCSDDGSGGCIK